MKNPARLLLAWFTFMGILTGTLWLGALLIYRDLLPYLGVDMDAPVSAVMLFFVVIPLGALAVGLLVYIGVIAWLILMRPFLPRATVYTIMTAGPHTAFDRWLLDTIYPPKKHMPAQKD